MKLGLIKKLISIQIFISYVFGASLEKTIGLICNDDATATAEALKCDFAMDINSCDNLQEKIGKFLGCVLQTCQKQCTENDTEIGDFVDYFLEENVALMCSWESDCALAVFTDITDSPTMPLPTFPPTISALPPDVTPIDFPSEPGSDDDEDTEQNIVPFKFENTEVILISIGGVAMVGIIGLVLTKKRFVFPDQTNGSSKESVSKMQVRPRIERGLDDKKFDFDWLDLDSTV